MKLVRWLIEAVRLDKETPQPQPQQTRKEAPPASLNMTREKAERIAANILYYERYKGDVFGKARTMTDSEIVDLITRFKADCLGE